MGKLNYNDTIYDIIDIVYLKGTHYVIMENNKDITYVNKIGEKYYAPIKNIKTSVTSSDYLEYLRKQYIMRCLIDYIKENELYSIAKTVIEHFKEYLKTNLVDVFLYWPYMNDAEFKRETKIIKTDIEAFLNERLHNRLLAKDNETIIIIDDYIVPTKDVYDDDLVPDPSFKK